MGEDIEAYDEAGVHEKRYNNERIFYLALEQKRTYSQDSYPSRKNECEHSAQQKCRPLVFKWHEQKLVDCRKYLKNLFQGYL